MGRPLVLVGVVMDDGFGAAANGVMSAAGLTALADEAEDTAAEKPFMGATTAMVYSQSIARLLVKPAVFC